jgi:hypothetical protein
MRLWACGGRRPRLINAGIELKAWYHTIASEQRALDVETQDRLMGRAVKFCMLMLEAGCTGTPKMHQFLHLNKSMCFHGNARHHACHEDENLNGALKKVGQVLHPLKFSETLFERLLVAEAVATD